MKRPKSNRKKRSQEISVVNPNAAGIDIGATHQWVTVPKDRAEMPVRRFESFTSDLHRLADWLDECGVETVAMESTGVYWIPVFQILESRGFEVKLVNAQHVKTVPGRKSDVLDCQWLQELHTFGLLSGSFRPEDEICVLRSYLRHRDSLGRMASTQVQRMQKALTQMNLQIQNVISDLTGKTGRAILEAILKGERDPQVLAQLKDPRIKSSAETIAKSLVGDYREEHLFCLRQAVELYDFYHCQLAECDCKIEAHLKRFEPKVDPEQKPLQDFKTKDKKYRRGNAPAFNLREEMYKICGVDLTQIEGINALTVLVVTSELGIDMSKFPTEKHLASYLGLSPNHKISGGKILKRSTRRVVNRVSQVLRMAALSLRTSSSYLGAYFRRMRSRLGSPKAVTATARKLACLIYRMLKYGQDYIDRGEEYYERKYREKVFKNLKKKAAQFGFQLTPKPMTTGVVS